MLIHYLSVSGLCSQQNRKTIYDMKLYSKQLSSVTYCVLRQWLLWFTFEVVLYIWLCVDVLLNVCLQIVDCQKNTIYTIIMWICELKAKTIRRQLEENLDRIYYLLLYFAAVFCFHAAIHLLPSTTHAYS